MILRLLIAITIVKSCTGDTSLYEKEAIESLNKIKSLQVFGEFIVILSKNKTEFEDGGDNFDEYLNSHIIRIKPPLDEDEYYDFEMKDLTDGNENENEARSRRQSLKKILISILLALIIKSTILVPIFTAFVALVAVKGFWAGMTALFVSKAIALNVFYQAQNKRDHDHEDHDEYEDQEEYHEHHDHHDHSFHHSPPPRLPYGTSHHGPREYGYSTYEKRNKPIVIYLNSDRQKANFGNWHEETSDVNNYHGTEAWGPWERDHAEFERQKWQNSSPNWVQGPW